MPLSRGELKGQVLRLLMKNAKFTGAYQDATIYDAIQEAMDFVATHMFIADQGWLDKIEYRDTEANCISAPIPETWAMVKEVRYLFGDVYVPLVYETASKDYQYSNQSGARQYAYTYRIVDNQIYFNPPMAAGGPKYLQIEYTAFPKFLQKDGDTIEPQFNRCFTNFMKYKSASILSATTEKPSRPWAKEEADWYYKMQELVAKRNMQSTQLLEYGF